MVPLDYSEFGTSKLGYQHQIDQASQALTDVMRDREAKRRLFQEATYKNAQIAQKNQELQLKLNQDARKQHDDDLKTAGELEEKVHALLQAGDEEGARALIAARGGGPGTQPAPAAPAPAPPPADLVSAMRARSGPAAQGDLSLGNLASPEIARQAEEIVGQGPTDEPQPGAGLPKPGEEPIRKLDMPLPAEMQRMQPRSLIDAMRARQGASRMPVVTPPPVDTGMPVQSPPEVDRDMVSKPPQVAADTAATPPTSTGRQFTYTTPDGRTVTMDAEQVRSGERKRAAKEFFDAQMAQAKALHQSASGQPTEQARATIREARQRMDDVTRLRALIEAGVVEPKNAGSQVELGVRERSGQQAQDERSRFHEGQANYRARLAADAAKQRQGNVVGEPDRRDLARYQADVSEIKKNTLANKDLQMLRNDREAIAGLADPNGPQFQLATDAMVKAATGGRVSVTLEQNYLKAMGLLKGAQNFIYKQTHEGKNMPSVVAAFRKVQHDASNELGRQLISDANAFENKAGVKSHWYQRPEFRPYVLDNRRAHYEALGLPAPPDPTDETAAPAAPVDSDEEFINR